MALMQCKSDGTESIYKATSHGTLLTIKLMAFAGLDNKKVAVVTAVRNCTLYAKRLYKPGA